MRGLSIQVHASVTPLRPPADVPAVATAFFVVKFIRSKDLFVIRPSLKVRSVMLPYKWLLSKKKKKTLTHPEHSSPVSGNRTTLSSLLATATTSGGQAILGSGIDSFASPSSPAA
jgi:hypothetical protein